jgi:GNAT superfamily N-acetyltransferase
MAELRAKVLKPDLERLERYDPNRVRQRFLDAFIPEHTRVLQLGEFDIGLVAVRPENHAVWIEHFYLEPALQGEGIGGQVLTTVLTEDTAGRPFKLNVLQGSPARRLYERHGFVLESQDAVDVYLTKPSDSQER